MSNFHHLFSLLPDQQRSVGSLSSPALYGKRNSHKERFKKIVRPESSSVYYKPYTHLFLKTATPLLLPYKTLVQESMCNLMRLPFTRLANCFSATSAATGRGVSIRGHPVGDLSRTILSVPEVLSKPRPSILYTNLLRIFVQAENSLS